MKTYRVHFTAEQLKLIFESILFRVDAELKRDNADMDLVEQYLNITGKLERPIGKVFQDLAAG